MKLTLEDYQKALKEMEAWTVTDLFEPCVLNATIAALTEAVRKEEKLPFKRLLKLFWNVEHKKNKAL